MVKPAAQERKRATPASRPRRTLGFILLVAGLGVFSLMGWLRLAQALERWQMLALLGVWPGPAYLAAGGALWGVAGLISGVALWLRLPHSFALARAAALVYALTYWLDRLWVVRSPAAHANRPFALLLTVAGLVFTFLILRQAEAKRRPVEAGEAPSPAAGEG